jgi:phage/plasmid-associated DNA primase
MDKIPLLGSSNYIKILEALEPYKIKDDADKEYTLIDSKYNRYKCNKTVMKDIYGLLNSLEREVIISDFYEGQQSDNPSALYLNFLYEKNDDQFSSTQENKSNYLKSLNKIVKNLIKDFYDPDIKFYNKESSTYAAGNIFTISGDITDKSFDGNAKTQCKWTNINCSVFVSKYVHHENKNRIIENTEFIIYTLLSKEFKKYIINEFSKSPFMKKIERKHGIFNKNSHLENIPLYSSHNKSRTNLFNYKVRVGIDIESIDALAIREMDLDLNNRTFEHSILFSNVCMDKILVQPKEEIRSKIEITSSNSSEIEKINTLFTELNIAINKNTDIKYMKQMLDCLPKNFYIDDNLKIWYRVYHSLNQYNEKYNLLTEFYLYNSPLSLKNKIYDTTALIGILEIDEIYDSSYIERIVQKYDPKKYKQIRESHPLEVFQKKILETRGNISSADIAEYLYSLFKGIYTLDEDLSEKDHSDKWYEFIVDYHEGEQGNIYKWVHRKSPDSMKIFLKDKLRPIILTIANKLNDNASHAISKDNKAQFVSIIKKLMKWYGNLGEPLPKENIIKESKLLFIARGFIEGLDKNGKILGVGNGIIILGAEPKLITTIHSYKVSKFTKIIVDPKYTQCKEVEDFLYDPFYERDAGFKIIMYMASSLDGCGKIPKLLIIDGPLGSNGKSTLAEIHSNAIGSYGDKIPSSAYINAGRLSADKPNPAYELFYSKRFLYSSENKKGAMLSTDILREILSGEKFSNRTLHKEQHSGYINCRLTHITNNKLKLTEFIYAIARRLLSYTMKYTYKPAHEHNPGNKFEKIANPTYITTLKEDPIFLSKYLSYLIFNVYSSYIRDYKGNIDNVPSETMDRELNDYFMSQDTILRFLTKKIRITTDYSDLTIEEIEKKYEIWYSHNINKNVPKREDIKTDLLASKLEKYLVKTELTYILPYHRILVDEENDDIKFLKEGEYMFDDKIGFEKIKSLGNRQINEKIGKDIVKNPLNMLEDVNKVTIIENISKMNEDFNELELELGLIKYQSGQSNNNKH